MVHLYCQERGLSPSRPTNDGDVVLDVRAQPNVLRDFTGALAAVGFTSAGVSPEGHQHRWVRDRASIDLLIPQGLGRAAGSRTGITGGTTLATPGAQQAIKRSEPVTVQVEEAVAAIRRPNMLGALSCETRRVLRPKRPGQGTPSHGFRHSGGNGSGIRSNGPTDDCPRPALSGPDARSSRQLSPAVGVHRRRRAWHPRPRPGDENVSPSYGRRSSVAVYIARATGARLVASPPRCRARPQVLAGVATPGTAHSGYAFHGYRRVVWGRWRWSSPPSPAESAPARSARTFGARTGGTAPIADVPGTVDRLGFRHCYIPARR